MQPLTVAIVAVEDFSPFHFSVPCIIFSDKVAAKKALRRAIVRRTARYCFLTGRFLD